MTTFTLEGVKQVEIDTDGDGNPDVSYFAPTTMEIVMDIRSNGIGGSYNYTYSPNGDFEVDFEEDADDDLFLESRVDGVLEPDTDTAYMMHVTTTDGFDAFVVQLDYGTNENFMFSLSGDALPVFSSPAEAIAFENQMTLTQIMGGPLGPNQVINFSDWGNVTITQDDTFLGNAGRDIFFGRAGNDTFHSSEGNDVFHGGAAFDTVLYLYDLAGVTVDLSTRTATDGWGDTDQLISIELVAGSNLDDTFIGNGKNNSFIGMGGDDHFDGGNGVDTLRYDLEEQYHGSIGSGIDIDLIDGEGTDFFGNDDTFSSIENVYGTSMHDVIFGDNQNNYLSGGAGDDLMSGEKGNDVLVGAAGSDNLHGNEGNDRIFGGRGRDILNGGDGGDILVGGGGGDELSGGRGSDTMTGGGGTDMFVFERGFGSDVITDFNATNNAEKINFSAVNTISSIGDLRFNHLSQVGNDAVIDAGNGNVLILRNVDINDLHNADFIF